jgi:hypothetical protein
MNKKQKILTAVALAAFSAIILLHYGSIGYEFPYTYQTSQILHKPDVSDGSSPHNLTKDPSTAKPLDPAQFPDQFTAIEHRGGGLYLGPPFFPDIHMPLFVLAVFYVALFFMLRDKAAT